MFFISFKNELCKLYELNKLSDLRKLYRSFMNHLESVEIA